MRVDKFTWAVRLFKTRSIASKSVDLDKVKVNEAFVKRGKVIKVGDEVSIKVNPIWKRYKIVNIPKSRLGAKLVADYIIETTPEHDLQELEHIKSIQRVNLSMGIKGRPTKKDRRDIDRLTD